MAIFETSIVQQSPEWFAAKLGKPSSSKMSHIITPLGKPAKHESYLWELAAERVSGMYAPSYQSKAMEAGIEKEDESRTGYEMICRVQVEQVGMIYQNEDRKFLCSPDGIINREYGLELKNVLPKTQVGYLLAGVLPYDYVVQVQSSLAISEFNRWDFFSVADGLPPFRIKVHRDNVFIAKLQRLLEDFCEELDAVTDRLRALQ